MGQFTNQRAHSPTSGFVTIHRRLIRKNRMTQKHMVTTEPSTEAIWIGDTPGIVILFVNTEIVCFTFNVRWALYTSAGHWPDTDKPLLDPARPIMPSPPRLEEGAVLLLVIVLSQTLKLRLLVTWLSSGCFGQNSCSPNDWLSQCVQFHSVQSDQVQFPSAARSEPPSQTERFLPAK